MKKLIVKILLFFTPLILLLGGIIWMDIFKIFGFQDYYGSDTFIPLNRGVVTSTTYNHFRKDQQFDSFIFGNSKSQAYKCKSWKKYLKEEATPFHFDANGEGIRGILAKVNYIDSTGGKLKNALFIIDKKTIERTTFRGGHLFISDPSISHESKFSFYKYFVKATLTPEFLRAYFDYKINGVYKDYMSGMIYKDNYPPSVNEVNCDFWYGNDEAINKDSSGYYQNLIEKGVFYKRSKVVREEGSIGDELKILEGISKVLKRQNTDYKIIISPSYDQIPLEKSSLDLLIKVFGEKNVFDYSGVNKFTEKIGNYYEAHHYRPSVANEIMQDVYNLDSLHSN